MLKDGGDDGGGRGSGEGGCRTASLGLESLTVDTLDAVSGTSFCSN